MQWLSDSTIVAASGTGLIAYLSAVLASKRLAPDREASCVCPSVGAVLALIVAAVAWRVGCTPAAVWAAPLGSLAAADMHTRRLPHEMTCIAALAVVAFGVFWTGEAALPAATIVGGIAALLSALLVSEKAAGPVWQALPLVAATVAIGISAAFSRHDVVVPLMAGIAVGLLMLGAWGSTTWVGAGDYGFVGAWAAVACWLGLAANGAQVPPSNLWSMWAGWSTWAHEAALSLTSALAATTLIGLAVVGAAAFKGKPGALRTGLPAGPVFGMGMAIAAVFLAIA